MYRYAIQLVLFAAALLTLSGCDRILRYAAGKQMSGIRTDMLTDGSLHVILVGSGG